MFSGQIEISQTVHIEAAIHFRVERDEWEAMTDDQRREAIGRQIDSAAIRASNDCFDYPDGTISASIFGPENKDINLDEIEIYDPEAR